LPWPAPRGSCAARSPSSLTASPSSSAPCMTPGLSIKEQAQRNLWWVQCSGRHGAWREHRPDRSARLSGCGTGCRVTVALRCVTWPRTVRIIRSIHLPIDLFEDIADPADWEALASAEAKFNPRIRESIGYLSKVQIARRATGLGANWVMAPVVHCSPLRPGRSAGCRRLPRLTGLWRRAARGRVEWHHVAQHPLSRAPIHRRLLA
jgi:hypothetical protein